MIASKCVICGSDNEIFIKKEDIPDEAKYELCEECIKKYLHDNVMLIDKENTRNNEFIPNELFEKIFKKIPPCKIAICASNVFDKYLEFKKKINA